MGQIGSVYKQPGKREDGSCHSWRAPSKWKGVQRGVKEGQQGEQGELGRGKRDHATYICNCNMCKRITRRRMMLLSCTYNNGQDECRFVYNNNQE